MIPHFCDHKDDHADKHGENDQKKAENGDHGVGFPMPQTWSWVGLEHVGGWLATIATGVGFLASLVVAHRTSRTLRHFSLRLPHAGKAPQDRVAEVDERIAFIGSIVAAIMLGIGFLASAVGMVAADNVEAETSARLSEANARTNRLESDVDSLKPKKFSLNQLVALQHASALSVSMRLSVVSDLSCNDCEVMAHQLRNALQQVGWAVDIGSLIGAGIRSASGITIFVPDKNSISPQVQALLNGFLAAGVQYDVYSRSLRSNDDICEVQFTSPLS